MRPSRSAAGWQQYATLLGVAVVAFFSVQNWNETRKLQAAFGNVDTRLTQIATKVDQAARPAPQQQRGPDPNKVHQVKTDSAPSEGPKSAPVVIAEFSDFQ
jgi:protein-disulfide isomerase